MIDIGRRISWHIIRSFGRGSRLFRSARWSSGVSAVFGHQTLLESLIGSGRL